MRVLHLFRFAPAADLAQRITNATGYIRLVEHLDGTVSGNKPGQHEHDRTWFCRASDFQVSHG